MEGGITGKGFKKGDPRINRKGRPKSFDALRKLAQSLAVEPAMTVAEDGKTKIPVIIDGHVATNVEMIMREWLREKQKEFVEVAFGKAPQPLELSGPEQGPIELKRLDDYRTLLTPLSPGPVADSTASSQDESSGDGKKVG